MMRPGRLTDGSFEGSLEATANLVAVIAVTPSFHLSGRLLPGE